MIGFYAVVRQRNFFMILMQRPCLPLRMIARGVTFIIKEELNHIFLLILRNNKKCRNYE